MSGPFWTPARIGELRARVRAKEPYRSIADDWGVSKNVVIGKAHRIGLSHPSGRGPVKPLTTLLDRLAALDPFPPPGRCRFPHGTGPYRFCGKPVAITGSSYCRTHLRATHVPASRQEVALRSIEAAATRAVKAAAI